MTFFKEQSVLKQSNAIASHNRAEFHWICFDAVHAGKRWTSNMATSTGQDGKAGSTSNVDLLLHPELLSQEFMQLILSEVS